MKLLKNIHFQSALIAIAFVTFMLLTLIYFGDVVTSNKFYIISSVVLLIVGYLYYRKSKEWPVM